MSAITGQGVAVLGTQGFQYRPHGLHPLQSNSPARDTQVVKSSKSKIDARTRLLANGVASLLLTLAGYASAWLGYGERVPWLYRAIWGGTALVLFAYWIAAIIVAAVRIRPGQRPGFRRTRQALEFGTFLGVNGVTWLFMPYGTTELQHVTLLFSTSYCAATVLSSADADAFTRWRIAIVMGGLAAQSVILRIPLWPYLAAYLVVLALVFMTFDQLVRRLINDLEAARREAEIARDARTRFLQAATHDLGQPLQAARLFHEQALRAAEDDQRKDAANDARAAFGAMERLLHSILDHLRLSEGRVTPRIKKLPVDELFSGLVRQYSAVATLQGIDLAAYRSDCVVQGDLSMCERVLGNLIDNALRHARPRRVRLGLRKGANGAVRLFVADDGVGLPVERVADLFDDFTQGPGHAEGGFGLGLASARRAALAMGGSLEHEQRWRQGTQFFLELPAVP